MKPGSFLPPLFFLSLILSACTLATQKSVGHLTLQSNYEEVLIKGDTFKMGDIFGYYDSTHAQVQHHVQLDDFYLGTKEVTVADFADFIEATQYITDAEVRRRSWVYIDNFWQKKDDINWRHGYNGDLLHEEQYNFPVVHVSWQDVIRYCNWRSIQEKRTPVYIIDDSEPTPHFAYRGINITAVNWKADGYRLPTEAEWEFAARNRGQYIEYPWGETNPRGNLSANNPDDLIYNPLADTPLMDGHPFVAPAGSYLQGELGLYDMSGNVSEWCWDLYDEKYYETSPFSNPKGPDAPMPYQELLRVKRGGSWISFPIWSTTTFRLFDEPDVSTGDIGFRMARSVE